MAIIVFATNVAGFSAGKVFPILLECLDLYGCMLLFGCGCLVGTVFVVFILEETTGKSLDSIDINDTTQPDSIRATRLNSISKI